MDAKSIIKKHQLDIPVSIKMDKATSDKVSKLIESTAKQWQGDMEGALKTGIIKGLSGEGLQEAVNQLNNILKSFNIEELINIKDLQGLEKPFEEAGRLAMQSFANAFKFDSIGNSLTKDVTKSLDNLSDQVSKIYQKMDVKTRDTAKNISKSVSEIESAAKRLNKKKDLSVLDHALSVKATDTSVSSQRTGLKNKYQQSVNSRKNNVPWETQYAADIEFAKYYKHVQDKQGNEGISKVFGDQANQVTDYFNKLLPTIGKKMSALNDVLATKDYTVGGKGYTITKSGHTVDKSVGGVSYVAENEPWARETTLKEVRDLLKNGINVNESKTSAKSENKEDKIPKNQKNKTEEIPQNIVKNSTPKKNRYEKFDDVYAQTHDVLNKEALTYEDAKYLIEQYRSSDNIRFQDDLDNPKILDHQKTQIYADKSRNMNADIEKKLGAFDGDFADDIGDALIDSEEYSIDDTIKLIENKLGVSFSKVKTDIKNNTQKQSNVVKSEQVQNTEPEVSMEPIIQQGAVAKAVEQNANEIPVNIDVHPAISKAESQDVENTYAQAAKEAESAYDTSVEKVSHIQENLQQARVELEKIQKISNLHGYTQDMSPKEAGKTQTTLNAPVDKKYPNYTRSKYVVNQLEKGAKPMQSKGGDYGFSEDNGNSYQKITKTEYEYAKYLQAEIAKLNVGFVEGLQILESQNGQLEIAKNNVITLEKAETEALTEKDVAYGKQTIAHNNTHKIKRETTTVKEPKLENNSALIETQQNDQMLTSEVTNMQTLKDKIDEVTSAVNMKTEAFKNEEAVVDSVINSENAQLKILEETINRISVSLNNIKTGKDDVNVDNLVSLSQDNVEPINNTSSPTISTESINQIVDALSKSQNTVSIDDTSLRNLLESITYTVVFDSDANQKRIDELRASLKPSSAESFREDNTQNQDYYNRMSNTVLKTEQDLNNAVIKNKQDLINGLSIFREHSFALEKGNVKEVIQGTMHNTNTSMSGLKGDTFGHLHPSNTVYSATDIDTMLKRKQANPAYDVDKLITPDFIYEISGIAKLQPAVLEGFKTALSKIEAQRANGDITKQQYSELTERALFDISKGGANISKSILNDNGTSMLVKSSGDTEFDAVKSLYERTQEINNRLDELYKSTPEEQWDDNKDILQLETELKDVSNNISKFTHGNHSFVHSSSSVLQAASDHNLPLHTLESQLYAFANDISSSKTQIPEGSDLSVLVKEINKIQTSKLDQNTKFSEIDKLSPLLENVFGRNPNAKIDSRDRGIFNRLGNQFPELKQALKQRDNWSNPLWSDQKNYYNQNHSLWNNSNESFRPITDMSEDERKQELVWRESMQGSNKEIKATIDDASFGKLSDAISKISFDNVKIDTSGLALEDTLGKVLTVINSLDKKISSGTKVINKTSEKSNNNPSSKKKETKTSSVTGTEMRDAILNNLFSDVRKFDAQRKSSGLSLNDDQFETYQGLMDDLFSVDDKGQPNKLIDGSAIKLWNEKFRGLKTDVGTDKIEKSINNKVLKSYTQLGSLGVQKNSLDANSEERKGIELKIALLEQEIKDEKVLSTVTSEQINQARILGATEEKAKLQTVNGKKSDIQIIQEQKQALSEVESLYARIGKIKADADLKTSQEGKTPLLAEIDALEKEASQLITNNRLFEDQLTTQKQLDEISDKSKRTTTNTKLAAQNERDAKKSKNDALKASIAEDKREYRYRASESAYTVAKSQTASSWQLEDAGVDLQSLPELNQLAVAMDKLKTIQDKIRNQGGIFEDTDGMELKNATVEVEKYSARYKELMSNFEKYKDANIMTNSYNSSADLKTQLESTVQAYTNGTAKIKSYNQATGELIYEKKTGTREFTQFTAAIRQSDNALVSLEGTTRKTESVLSTIKRKTGEIFTYFSGSSLIFKAVNEIRQGIQYVKEIDSALTELRKVTDETEATYDNFLDTASQTASRVGSTIKDVVNSTADFARLGYSLRQASELAESAQILMNTSEFTDINTATDSLISSIKAFDYTAEQSMHVVDVLNEIGEQHCLQITISVKDQRWLRPK